MSRAILFNTYPQTQMTRFIFYFVTGHIFTAGDEINRETHLAIKVDLRGQAFPGITLDNW